VKFGSGRPNSSLVEAFLPFAVVGRHQIVWIAASVGTVPSSIPAFYRRIAVHRVNPPLEPDKHCVEDAVRSFDRGHPPPWPDQTIAMLLLTSVVPGDAHAVEDARS
jgi:hypothetical protein